MDFSYTAEQERFRQNLTGDNHPACTHGHPQGDLASPADVAREHDAGDVGAGEQQEHRPRRQQKHGRGLNVIRRDLIPRTR